MTGFDFITEGLVAVETKQAGSFCDPTVCSLKGEPNQLTLKFRIKGGGWRFEEVKTEASLRTVRFNKALAKALARHKRQQSERRLKSGQKYQNNELVFSTSLGMPLQIRNFTLRHFRPILKRAKLNTKMHLYCLRHSYATLSLLAGVDPKAVSASLGHTRVSFTLDTYQHLLPVMSRDAAERVGQILFSSLR